MKIGYARVSTADQTTAAQLHALEQAQCSSIYQDKAGGTAKRPELERALAVLNAGDVLTVWRFDRLARSLPDLLRIVTAIEAKGAHLASITEQIDTSSPAGRVMFHIMGALAQFERDIIRERTNAGLAAARSAGRTGGRPRALTPAQVRHAAELVEGGQSVPAVARTLKVAPATLRTAIAAHRA